MVAQRRSNWFVAVCLLAILILTGVSIHQDRTIRNQKRTIRILATQPIAKRTT